MSTATADEFGIPEDLAPAKKTKSIDPEDDRKNWPVIHIDFEDGKSNFEFLAARGTKKDGSPFNHELKVQRGVDVAVPPSVVNMLRTSIAARYHQGDLSQPVRRTDRSALPWQLVEKGKYIK
jgi:hypothetical protein